MLFKKESTYILGEGFTLKHFIKDKYNTQMLTLKCVKHIIGIILIWKYESFRFVDALQGFKCTKKVLEESKSGTNVH